MPFCPNCGSAANTGANYCGNCGAPLNQASSPLMGSGIKYTASSAALGDHTVTLLSTGSCSIADAANFLSDICGYSDQEAAQLAASTPVAVARNLTETQAAYLAQALSEYGMEATVYDRTGYKQVSTGEKSLFSSNGSFIAKAAAVLGLIGIGNRITKTARWTNPFRVQPIVVTRPVIPPKPRRHILRNLFRPAPPPKPSLLSGILGAVSRPQLPNHFGAPAHGPGPMKPHNPGGSHFPGWRR